VSPATALALFLTDPDHGGDRRRVAVGQPGDLCLLHTPLAVALAEPSAEQVRAVLRD
jgi:hypothetical protein